MKVVHVYREDREQAPERWQERLKGSALTEIREGAESMVLEFDCGITLRIEGGGVVLVHNLPQ